MSVTYFHWVSSKWKFKSFLKVDFKILSYWTRCCWKMVKLSSSILNSVRFYTYRGGKGCHGHLWFCLCLPSYIGLLFYPKWYWWCWNLRVSSSYCTCSACQQVQSHGYNSIHEIDKGWIVKIPRAFFTTNPTNQGAVQLTRTWECIRLPH